MTIGADIGYYGCCGFQEICTFQRGIDAKRYNNYSADTPEGLIAEIFNGREPDQLFHIWFMNKADYNGTITPGNYEFDDLRQYVRTIPGVVHLGEHINPNSNNQIDGYMFKKAE